MGNRGSPFHREGWSQAGAPATNSGGGRWGRVHTLSAQAGVGCCRASSLTECRRRPLAGPRGLAGPAAPCASPARVPALNPPLRRENGPERVPQPSAPRNSVRSRRASGLREGRRLAQSCTTCCLTEHSEVPSSATSQHLAPTLLSLRGCSPHVRHVPGSAPGAGAPEGRGHRVAGSPSWSLRNPEDVHSDPVCGAGWPSVQGRGLRQGRMWLRGSEPVGGGSRDSRPGF